MSDTTTVVDRGSTATKDDRNRDTVAGKQKLSLNLTDEAAQVVRDIAAAKGVSVTEVIRRGISLERFILDQLDAGSTFFTRRRDGTIETVHFVF